MRTPEAIVVLRSGARELADLRVAYLSSRPDERNHQGLDNRLIAGTLATELGRVRCGRRLGGLLNSYERAVIVRVG